MISQTARRVMMTIRPRAPQDRRDATRQPIVDECLDSSLFTIFARADYAGLRAGTGDNVEMGFAGPIPVTPYEALMPSLSNDFAARILMAVTKATPFADLAIRPSEASTAF